MKEIVKIIQRLQFMGRNEEEVRYLFTRLLVGNIDIEEFMDNAGCAPRNAQTILNTRNFLPQFETAIQRVFSRGDDVSMGDKVPVTLRLDEDIIERFKKLATTIPGAKYQALMSEALKEYLEKQASGGLEARVAKLESEIFKKKS